MPHNETDLLITSTPPSLEEHATRRQKEHLARSQNSPQILNPTIRYLDMPIQNDIPESVNGVDTVKDVQAVNGDHQPVLDIHQFVNGIDQPANCVGQPLNDVDQPAGETLTEKFEKLKNYILSLGLPPHYSEELSEHVANMRHEDVPTSRSESPEELVPTSIPPVDPKIPARLRPTIPPINFGAVVKGSIYRSGYPAAENFSFLQGLKLKTILTLVPEPIPGAYSTFMSEHGIQHFQVHIPANKEKVRIGACEMSRALEIVLDRSNHPLLIHCNKGKHRTGCVVGCFRRVQGEEFGPIFEEYHTYANPKARILDEAFIELFDEHTVLWMAKKFNWVQHFEAEPSPPSPVPTLDLAKSLA